MSKIKTLLIVLMAILLVSSVQSFGQPQAGGEGRGADAMSGRQGAMGRGQGGGMRGGMLNVESVNTAVAAIEYQVTTIKQAMEYPIYTINLFYYVTLLRCIIFNLTVLLERCNVII
ncbi:hypothetical protein ACFLZ8_00700, partial [Planctomycetota bacterium]